MCTSLASELADSFFLTEELENPHLGEFYDHLSRFPGQYNPHAFPMQAYFFEQRERREREAQRSGQFLIVDRFLQEYFEIFVRNMFDSGLISPGEFEALREKHHEAMTPDIHPQVVYLLTSSLEENYRRVQKRARDFEKANLSLSYLSSLAEKYSQFAETLRSEFKDIQLVLLDTQGLSPSDVHKAVREDLDNRIRKK